VRSTAGSQTVLDLMLRRPQQGADTDPPNWELIAPDGLVLEFGPGIRWRIGHSPLCG
jgi:hypothetical protein